MTNRNCFIWKKCNVTWHVDARSISQLDTSSTSTTWSIVFLENRLIAQFHSCTNKSLSLNQYQLQLKKWVTKKSETIYLIHETVGLFGLGFRISPIQLYNSWCTYQDLDTVVSSLFFCVLKMTMHWNVTLSGKRFSLNSIFILKFQVAYLMLMIN